MMENIRDLIMEQSLNRLSTLKVQGHKKCDDWLNENSYNMYKSIYRCEHRLRQFGYDPTYELFYGGWGS